MRLQTYLKIVVLTSKRRIFSGLNPPETTIFTLWQYSRAASCQEAGMSQSCQAASSAWYASVIAAALFASTYPANIGTRFLIPALPFVALALALLIGLVAQIGDLCESMMKRTFATKESGWIFPGHGGVLDRIDSLVFPVPLLYYYLLWR